MKHATHNPTIDGTEASTEHGVTAVLTAILATVLLGSAGFAVDIGNAMQTQRRSQNAADSAAFAGLQYLVQHTNDSALELDLLRNAALEAKRYADLNTGVSAADWASCVDNNVPAGYVPVLTIGTGSCISIKALGGARMRVKIPAQVKTGFGRVLGISTIGANASADVGEPATTTTTTTSPSTTTSITTTVAPVTSTIAFVPVTTVPAVTTTVAGATTTVAGPTTTSSTTTTAPTTTTSSTTSTTTTTTMAPCLNPLLSNPSFENGLAGWQYSGNVQTWNQFVAEGTRSAYGQATSWLRQTVPASPGFNYRMTFNGGTHNPGMNATSTMQFLNGSGTILAQTTPFQMDFDVDIQPGGGVSAPYPTQRVDLGYGAIGGPYTVNMVAPAGTTQVRMLIEATGGDYFKIDNMQIAKC